MLLRVFVTLGVLSSTAFASPSYRWQTITADSVGLALVFGAGAAEGDGGRDTALSNAMLGAGALTMLAAAPMIHFGRDHLDRAKHSLALRGGLAAAGIVTAIVLNTGCGDGEPAPPEEILDADFLCEVEYVGYGMVAGLVVASVIDAAFMTDERVVRTTWAPQITASRDGVRAGAAFAW